MSRFRDAEEPGSRLLLAVVLVAVCIVFAGLLSVRRGPAVDARHDASATAQTAAR